MCWDRGREKGSQSLGGGDVWGRQPAPYLSALKTKLTLTPSPHQSSPSGEVTCLSPGLEVGGRVLLRTGCLGTGWSSAPLLDRIASLWAELWPWALPPPSAPIPPSVDTIGAVC